jgi:hypothetical protein
MLPPPPEIPGDRPAIATLQEAVLVSRLGIVIYTALIFLSIFYYLERTVFVDISFHLFSLITTETWAIQNFRFGALFTQALPLLGIKLGLSLKALAILYSISFPVLYMGIFLVVVRYLHQPRLGLVLLGYNTLMVTDTFYWIQSELSQGVAFLILYLALLFRQHDQATFQSNPVWQIIHPILLFILVFFHPLIIFVYAFLGSYFWISRTIDRHILTISGVAFGSMYAIKLLFFKTAYDSKSMEGVRNIIQFFPDYMDIPTMRAFVGDLVHDYYLLLLGLLVILIWGIIRGRWLILFLVVGCFLGYALLVNCSYPEDTVKFYRENLHLPLAVFVLAPLLFQVLPERVPHAIWLTLVLIGLIRLVHIQHAHAPYTERLDWMRSFLRDHPGQKLIVDDHSLPLETLMMTWATPYEFWLLSTLETGQTASIMLTDKPQEVKWAIDMPDHFIAKWGAFPYGDLPDRYFHFNDQAPYMVIGSDKKDE